MGGRRYAPHKSGSTILCAAKADRARRWGGSPRTHTVARPSPGPPGVCRAESGRGGGGQGKPRAAVRDDMWRGHGGGEPVGRHGARAISHAVGDRAVRARRGGERGAGRAGGEHAHDQAVGGDERAAVGVAQDEGRTQLGAVRVEERRAQQRLDTRRRLHGGGVRAGGRVGAAVQRGLRPVRVRARVFGARVWGWV